LTTGKLFLVCIRTWQSSASNGGVLKPWMTRGVLQATVRPVVCPICQDDQCSSLTTCSTTRVLVQQAIPMRGEDATTSENVLSQDWSHLRETLMVVVQGQEPPLEKKSLAKDKNATICLHVTLSTRRSALGRVKRKATSSSDQKEKTSTGLLTKSVYIPRSSTACADQSFACSPNDLLKDSRPRPCGWPTPAACSGLRA
jgi:hypothetical protein